MKNPGLAFLFDFLGLSVGLVTYILLAIMGWNRIYYTDHVYNGLTRRIMTNADGSERIFELNELLSSIDCFLKIGVCIFVFILWGWCFTNNLCIRYYCLVLPFTWSITVFYGILLQMYWDQERFKDYDQTHNLVSIPDDKYLNNVSSILSLLFLIIPLIVLVGSSLRNAFMTCVVKNQNTKLPKYRRPQTVDQCVHGVMIDMCEFFLVPVIYVSFIMCVVILVCTCGNDTGHYESGGSSNMDTDMTSTEKGVGCMNLERMADPNPDLKSNPFERIL